MLTLQNSNSKQTNGMDKDFNGTENALPTQSDIVREFFKRDSGSEMIESLHTMVEMYLFSEDLKRVPRKMRTHIVNQLRVATLIAKLDKSDVA